MLYLYYWNSSSPAAFKQRAWPKGRISSTDYQWVDHERHYLSSINVIHPAGDQGTLNKKRAFLQKIDVARHAFIHIWVVIQKLEIVHSLRDGRISFRLWFDLFGYGFIRECELATICVVDDGNLSNAKQALRNDDAS